MRSNTALTTGLLCSITTLLGATFFAIQVLHKSPPYLVIFWALNLSFIWSKMLTSHGKTEYILRWKKKLMMPYHNFYAFSCKTPGNDVLEKRSLLLRSWKVSYTSSRLKYWSSFLTSFPSHFFQSTSPFLKRRVVNIEPAKSRSAVFLQVQK